MFAGAAARHGKNWRGFRSDAQGRALGLGTSVRGLDVQHVVQKRMDSGIMVKR